MTSGLTLVISSDVIESITNWKLQVQKWARHLFFFDFYNKRTAKMHKTITF